MPFSPHSLQLPACTDGRDRAGQAAGAAGLPGEGTHREGGHPQHPPWGPGISPVLALMVVVASHLHCSIQACKNPGRKVLQGI